MPEKVTYNEELDIVQVESYGNVSIEELETSLSQVLKYHKEQGVKKGYVDATRLQSFPASLSIYDFGLQLVDSLLNLNHINIAVAISPVIRRDFLFLETVVRNRGIDMRVFDSPEVALEWLQSA